MNHSDRKRGALVRALVAFGAAFTSAGTLLCCALPAAIAAVAGGAAVGSLVSAFPWLIPLSRHKGWIFFFAGCMLLLSGVLTFRPKGRLACSLSGGQGCQTAGGITKCLLWFSITIYTIGAFFAYGLVPLLRLLEG